MLTPYDQLFDSVHAMIDEDGIAGTLAAISDALHAYNYSDWAINGSHPRQAALQMLIDVIPQVSQGITDINAQVKN